MNQTMLILGALGIVGAAVVVQVQHWGERMIKEIQEAKDASDAAFARFGVAVSGISGDIADLKRQIDELRNSNTLSEEDKAALTSIAAKANEAASNLEALDALTAPATPPPTTQPPST